ncbi:MAG: CDGSH iron-sulfur domain-containing protein [Acidobacteriota bacterium]|nr:CDGSH iron-sulfur domain-containing protein [Acidobacteriota bacterium]
MAEFSIRATQNGPLIVKGAAELLDTVGDRYPLDKDTISLCRCWPVE